MHNSVATRLCLDNVHKIEAFLKLSVVASRRELFCISVRI